MIDLSGIWQFAIDPKDVGVDQQWWRQGLPMQIRLPGSLQEQGYGEDPGLDTAWVGTIIDRSLFEDPRYAPYREPGNFKVPFWLQPDKHYNGAAWYQRSIEIPTEWQGRRITLSLERPHWETTVWLDDRRLGTRNSLSTAHVYDLGIDVKPGLHRLTIQVDNRMIVDVGVNAHSVSDHTQSNWNGIVGRIALEAGPAIWVRSVQVFPNIQAKTARVKIDFDSALGTPGRGTVTVQATGRNGPYEHRPEPLVAPVQFAALGGLADLDLSTRGGHVDIEYQLGEGTLLWDEFQPALYDLSVQLDVQSGGAEHHAAHTVTFGMREIAPQGTQLAINGRPIFLRGTLECCIFPLTGYPPADGEAWKRIIRICQAHGLNHIRFHSWCPPEAAFAAADELGFYYQVEIVTWANQGAAIGEGRPLDQWLYAEADRIVNAYGNHPSFLLMAYGNEPAGRDAEFLALWNTYWRKRDSRRAYTGGAGWPNIPENEYHNTYQPRIQLWGAGLKSRINGLPPETRTDYREYMQAAGIPVVSHEIGQWCVYPNFAEIDKYTGVLKAKNFEIFRDFLEANHMGDQAHDFLIASGKLQALCYKEEIESALRTPGMAGLQLLDLHDFPGQGTALVGVLDPFWDEKGYITAAEFRRFCNSTVPLALLDKRYWRTGETLAADITIAHYGSQPLDGARLDWQLVYPDGSVAASGAFAAGEVALGSGTIYATIQQPLKDMRPAQKLRLVVAVTAGNDGQRFENDWDLWVFADEVETAWPASVHVCARLDAEAQAALDEGRTVLMLPPADEVDAPAVLGFSSVFWNTAWTRNQAPHTLGILCDPAHPVFAHFPTESHSNWQWWELVHGAAAMRMDHLTPDLRPLVQVIDTWFEARRLGLLYEAQVGEGRLVVCSMDLQNDLENRLVARQMRYSLAQYLAG
ncbi:MAG: glycoside hydrolase [Caldilineaceae bacterium]